MEAFQARIVAWAQAEEAIRAVVVTGSLSRQDGTMDEWSDLDVQIITKDVARYTSNRRWLEHIGDVWLHFPLEPDEGFLLVWFAGGKKVDFNFRLLIEVQEELATGELSDEYQRGYRVIVDKDNLYSQLPPSPHISPMPEPPSEHEFYSTVNEFWFEAIHVGQYIRRREFWVVKFRDWTMKTDLLQMMEWHARAQHNWQINTWIIGKRIEKWLDPETWQAIQRIWSGLEVAESWQALLAMIEVFNCLSGAVAEKLAFEYQAELYDEISEYIHELYAGDDLLS